MDYLWIIVMFLAAVWTLILTAPIHCRGSIGEQVMEWYISPNLFYILAWGRINFQQFHFWVNYSFTMFCESGPWFCKTSVSEVYLSFVYDLERCISVCSQLWLWSPSVCRRLDPSERPLQMVYDYLTAMGYEDPLRVQQEAANSDLSCMIRFYSGELWAVGGRFLLYWPGQKLALQSKLFESTRAFLLFRVLSRGKLVHHFCDWVYSNTTARVQICVFVYNAFSLFSLWPDICGMNNGLFLESGISVCQHQCWGDCVWFWLFLFSHTKDAN